MADTKTSKNDKLIPWYFVAFFVVLALLDGFFVFLATSSHTGLVTEHAYQKGLNYNRTIEAFNRQQKLGWQGEITFTQPVLAFRLADKNGNGIEGAEVIAYARRMTQSGYDFSISLTDMGNGIYEATPRFPLRGQWQITIAVKWQKRQYQRSRRILVE